MPLSTPKNSNVRLLACLVEPEDAENPDDSDYRFLVDGRFVKYVTTAPGTFSGNESDQTFGPILLDELLPPFPAGNWNKGHVAKDPNTREVTFVKTETMTFVAVKNVWHPLKLNELDFTQIEYLRQRVRISTNPEVNEGRPVIIKTAVWPWEIASMENETSAYERIRDRDISPRFLGHVTEGEGGRVIGFVTEWVQDGRTAGPGDLESCMKTLRRLHELGMKHGDINKHNFLVQEGRGAVLIDFETVQKCSDDDLEDEMNRLKNAQA